jgi:shikimate kinase
MGVGKTTVGQALAVQLGARFVDLDDLIETREGLSIAELFERGESHFRDAESAALRAVDWSGPLVLATGGGVVERIENRQLLSAKSAPVWLVAPFETVLARIAGSGRPLASGPGARAELERRWMEREALYRSLATLTVPSVREPDEVAREMVLLLGE